jgi:hypothetical protein
MGNGNNDLETLHPQTFTEKVYLPGLMAAR